MENEPNKQQENGSDRLIKEKVDIFEQLGIQIL